MVIIKEEFTMGEFNAETRLELIEYSRDIGSFTENELKEEYSRILDKASNLLSKSNKLKRLGVDLIKAEFLKQEVRTLNAISDIVAHAIAIKVVAQYESKK